MIRSLTALLFLLMTPLVARAGGVQDPPRKDSGSAQREVSPREQAADLERLGLTAAQAGRLDEAIASFREILELVPTFFNARYNLACCFARRGDVETALAWLGRAVRIGNTNIDYWMQDPDLKPLHAEEGFVELVERVRKRLKIGEDYSEHATVYVPKGLGEKGPLAVLVVLHDHGDSMERVAFGPWRRVADRLGAALIVPSGRFLAPAAEVPGDGMLWWTHGDAYRLRLEQHQAPIHRALSEFRREHATDPERIWLVGEGDGAALAFDVAVTFPALYSRVLMVDGYFMNSSGARAPAAAELGLTCSAIFDRSRPRPVAVGHASVEFLHQNTRLILERWSMAGASRIVDGALGGEDARVLEFVHALEELASPGRGVPAEAGATERGTPLTGRKVDGDTR